MKPEQLRAEDFARYPAAAREFAVQYLPLLRRLPIAICPSFVGQMVRLDTAFPAERAALAWQCDSLLHLPPEKLAALLQPFAELSVPEELSKSDWVGDPPRFVADLSSALWSSGQIDRFRKASTELFAAIPPRDDHPHRLTMVVIGQGATVPAQPVFRKLKRHGVMLTALDAPGMPQQIHAAFGSHAAKSTEPYAHWYVDGGTPWEEKYEAIAGTVAISYPALDGLRRQTLSGIENVVESGKGGAEFLHAQLTGTIARDLKAAPVTTDPVLERFYTELFTQSSGPQIFSTSFVQWTGRELARRAQPRTLLLRYAPRQRYQPFNEMLKNADPQSVDAEGSLRDAEMGAWYTWIEMNRITRAGEGTFFAWLEGSSQGVLLGSSAPAGTDCTTPMTLDKALAAFG